MIEFDGFSFEKLEVYNLALSLARKVYHITSELKTDRFWTNQFNRAVTSISLNIAEGSGRWNVREKRNFYNIARGSVFECVPLVDLGLSLGILADKHRDELRQDCLSITKMLTKLIQSLEVNEKSPDPRT